MSLNRFFDASRLCGHPFCWGFAHSFVYYNIVPALVFVLTKVRWRALLII